MKNEDLEWIKKVTEPFRQMQKQMDDFKKIQPLVIPFQFAKIHQEYFTGISESIKKMIDPIKELQNSIAKLNFTPFQKSLVQLNEFGKRIKENYDRMPHSLLLLAKYGWFLDLDTDPSFPNELGELIESNEIEKVNEYLMEYYSDNLEQIFDDLTVKFPERKEIFNQIKIAHEEKLFFISIPTILSQIDGICFDCTTKKFFLKDKDNNYLPEVTTELSNISNSILKIFLTPILNQTAINARKKDLYKYPIQFNRHEILHGVDKNYGTEMNSLKCISLLKYMHDLLGDFES